MGCRPCRHRPQRDRPAHGRISAPTAAKLNLFPAIIIDTLRRMEDHSYALTLLATVLAAAFVGGAVFQRLRQPVLVGYIIVGIILGPSVLGLVQDRGDIGLMAELGILLLLFLAGMEID